MSSTLRNEDLLALKSYITSHDTIQYDHMNPDTLLLDLTHSNLKQRHVEIRFDKHDTVSTLRQRIHQKSGTPPCFQHLQLKSSNKIIFEIPPSSSSEFEHHKLGFFPLENGSGVHCIDIDPYSQSKNGQYEDVSLVEKYRMSEEEYDKRKNTLRDWGRRQKEKDEQFTLAKHAREHREKMEALRQYKLGLPLPEGWEVDPVGNTVVRVVVEEEDVENTATTNTTTEHEYGIESVQGITVGNRCQVHPGKRRGTVCFIGEVKELGVVGGYWVGVKLDEPVGKGGDGSVKGGTRYFDVPPGYGGFMRGKNVEVGDFPELDIFEDMSSDSEDEL